MSGAHNSSTNTQTRHQGARNGWQTQHRWFSACRLYCLLLLQRRRREPSQHSIRPPRCARKPEPASSGQCSKPMRMSLREPRLCPATCTSCRTAPTRLWTTLTSRCATGSTCSRTCTFPAGFGCYSGEAAGALNGRAGVFGSSGKGSTASQGEFFHAEGSAD